MMRPRAAQPPIQPWSRDPEQGEFWPGFILALLAAVLLVCGARHATNVPTQEGASAWEIELIRAFASSGLEYAETLPPTDPLREDDPAAAKPDQDRRGGFLPLKARYRVNTGAADPCPT